MGNAWEDYKKGKVVTKEHVTNNNYPVGNHEKMNLYDETNMI